MQCRLGGSTTAAELEMGTCTGSDDANPTTLPAVTPLVGCRFTNNDIVALTTRLAEVGTTVGRITTRQSGRAQSIKLTCAEVCSGAGFGAGCVPCPVSMLSTADDCSDTGPFGTGQLCHGINGAIVMPPTACCSRENPSATCYPPAEPCDCDAFNQPTLPFEVARSFNSQSGECVAL